MTGYIYMVTCSETNKVYIGQVTHEYHRRFNRHIRTAFKTKKRIKDCKFYRAIRKYGKDSFSVECLEKKPFQNLVECVKWLDEIEKRISPLRGRKQSTIEIENREEKLRGKKRTLEQRKHISDSLKGRTGVGRKAVYQYLDGKLLKTFDSLTQAALETSIGIGRINRCCLGKIISVDGFEFSYKLK